MGCAVRRSPGSVLGLSVVPGVKGLWDLRGCVLGDCGPDRGCVCVCVCVCEGRLWSRGCVCVCV